MVGSLAAALALVALALVAALAVTGSSLLVISVVAVVVVRAAIPMLGVMEALPVLTVTAGLAVVAVAEVGIPPMVVVVVESAFLDKAQAALAALKLLAAAAGLAALRGRMDLVGIPAQTAVFMAAEAVAQIHLTQEAMVRRVVVQSALSGPVQRDHSHQQIRGTYK